MANVYKFHRETEQMRYAQRRSEAYAAATRDAGDIGAPYRLANLNSKALRAWKESWVPVHEQLDGPGQFDWAKIAGGCFFVVDAFHLAVWSGDTLCGLAAGFPSDSHSLLSVHFLEGNPDPKHPLKGKVLALIIGAAEAYAAVLGASSLRLKDPEPSLFKLYTQQFGFTLENTSEGVKYCERRIE